MMNLPGVAIDPTTNERLLKNDFEAFYTTLNKGPQKNDK